MKKKEVVLYVIVAIIFIIAIILPLILKKEVKEIKIEKKSIDSYYYQKYNNKLIVETVLLCEKNFDISSDLIFAIIFTESNFNPTAKNVNKNGTIDRGLMQLNSNTFDNIAPAKLYDIESNIINGSKHYKELYTKLNNELMAICAYNCGLGAIKSGRISEKTLDYAEKVIKYKNKLNIERVKNENSK